MGNEPVKLDIGLGKLFVFLVLSQEFLKHIREDIFVIDGITINKVLVRDDIRRLFKHMEKCVDENNFPLEYHI